MVLISAVLLAIVGCNRATTGVESGASTAILPEARFNGLFLTNDELGAIMGQPISDTSRSVGQPNAESYKDDTTVPCNLMNSGQVSQFVYGDHHIRYRNVSTSLQDTSKPAQVFYTVALYPDEAEPTAAFERLANGFGACRWAGGRNGWFGFVEESPTKLVWTSKLSSTDDICAHNFRVFRNLVIASFTCRTENDIEHADKIAAAIGAKASSWKGTGHKPSS